MAHRLRRVRRCCPRCSVRRDGRHRWSAPHYPAGREDTDCQQRRRAGTSDRAFSRASTLPSSHALATRYANHQPPTCGCTVCRGKPLTRFEGYGGDIRAEANAHNAAAWNELLPALFREPGLGERQSLWKKICVAAYQAHETEAVRLRQKKAFEPPKDIRRFATLPVTHAPVPLPAPGL